MADKKKDIKIFVSTRIDLDSKMVDNPLYVPVRCGAVYDKRKNVSTLGDNTGENISERRMSYCELTVIYWMWKNASADYYGLSHYRRYLSFADETLPGAWQEQGFMDSMSDANLKRCGLLGEETMRKEIENYDMIVPVQFPVASVVTPRGTNYKSTYEYVTKAWEHLFIEQEDIDRMLEIIDQSFPEYSESAKEYMDGHMFRGFNIFILKKDLFNSLCEFEFGVLEQMDSLIDYSYASDSRKRAPGYLGEILYSIWVYHQTKNKDLKIKEKQIIFFQDTSKETSLEPVDKDVVTVCYPCTYEQIPFLGVSLQSLVDNISDDNRYRIIVLLKNMPENKYFVMQQNRQKSYLQEIVMDHDNVTLEFFDPKEGLGDVDVRLFYEADTKLVYYRLLLPWILKKLKKVVWLTPHVLICEDVAKLYQWDLESGSIAAAKDIIAISHLNGSNSDISRHLRLEVNLNDNHNYVDTDIMVMDLEKLRECYDYEALQTKIKSKRWKRLSVTHDAFNVFYEESVEILPQKWNVINRPLPEMLQCLDYAESDLVKEFGSVKKPCIINYKNHPTPWMAMNCDFSWEFWKVARKTPFYEQLLELKMVHDLQVRSGMFDQRSNARKLADRVLPLNSRRRNFAKRLLPKGSLRWKICKWIYDRMRHKPVYETKMTDFEMDEFLCEQLKQEELEEQELMEKVNS